MYTCKFVVSTSLQLHTLTGKVQILHGYSTQGNQIHVDMKSYETKPYDIAIYCKLISLDSQGHKA